MVSLPRLLLYLVWMWPLLHTLSGTPFASFFWALSCLRRLPYSQTSMYLSFSHHFSALRLSRNIVRLLFVCLLSSRCAYRGQGCKSGSVGRGWCSWETKTRPLTRQG